MKAKTVSKPQPPSTPDDQLSDWIQADQQRFWRASLSEGTKHQQEAAWRDFGKLVHRAFSAGRLWQPHLVYYLTPLLIVAVAEADELDRVDAAYKAAEGDQNAEAKLIAEADAMPSLRGVDALARGLEEPPDEARRLAGYLPPEYQPGTSPGAKVKGGRV